MKKIITLVFILAILALSYFHLVLAKIGTEKDIILVGTTTKNIYLNSKKLNNLVAIYESKKDISSYRLFSVCNNKSNYLGKRGDKYFFRLYFLDSGCTNSYLYLKNKDIIILNTKLKISIKRDFDALNYFLDLPLDSLKTIENNLNKKINKLKVYANSKNIYLSHIKNKLKYYEYNYIKNLAINIIKSRNKGYIVPVKGYKLPTLKSKIPNAGRPFRAKYTTGIHRGWDVGKLNDEVVSMSDGIVVRVVNNWQWKDFDKLRFGPNITLKQRNNNLDILRGNQVWVKTMKGDIVFYSHLKNVKVRYGDIVKSGQLLGQIGKSGVTDKSYTDFHLHFSINKNPKDIKKAGNYSKEEIMSWDFEMKGKDKEYVIGNQGKVMKSEISK